jgi:FxsC-like protein
VDRWFFFSYAREDRDPYLVRFRNELIEAVRVLVGGAAEGIGFFDTQDIAVGEDWPTELGQALQCCRAFIPLYSPTYFTKPFCGQEWAVFRERQDAWVSGQPAGTVRPPLVVPVLWVGVKQLPVLPAVAGDTQFDHETLGGEYAKRGLRQLLQNKKFETDAVDVVNGLAQAIVDAAKAHPLPPLPAMPSVKTIRSIFHGAAAAPQQAVGSTVGPRFVQFVFVAGRQAELRAVRGKVDLYGQDGRDWKPYYPEFSDEIELVAQEVAVGEKLRYEALPLDANLIPCLAKAEADNKIVALVVDTWTLQLDAYRRFMRDYDDRNFLNCVVLVPWNAKDDETTRSRAALEDRLRVTFLKRMLARDPASFLDAISSPDDLRKSLATALNAARMRILSAAEVKRRAEGDRAIAQPII